MIKHVLPILAGVGLIAASVHAQPELPDPTERIPGSDLWIEARLLTAYALNEHLNPFDIRVDSERGRVQLTGDVPSVVERKLAEQLAKDVGAVAQVDNQIRVQADDSDPTYTELYQLVEDANITTRIQLQLLWNRATNSVDINVDSNDGRVTLSGKVAGEEARERTVAIARRTEGVRSVDDQLQVAAAEEADEAVAAQAEQLAEDVAGAASDAWITTRVTASLRFDASVKDGRIDVDTKDGVVELSGAVRTEAEKEEAARIASGIVGVQKVQNQLQVDQSG